MKSFIRDNPTIAFGLGLPLLLVIVFLLVSAIPRIIVAEPQYTLLYATEYYDYQNGVQIAVIDRKVQVSYQNSEPNRRRPRLWRFDPQSGAVQEIAMVFPPRQAVSKENASDEAQRQTIVLDVPDLDGLIVDSSSIAPDGYQFSVGRGRYSGHLFSELFYASRNRYDAVLEKNGRTIHLPNSTGQYYSRNIRFIGWVVPL